MRAAVHGVDRVGKRIYRLGVSVGVLDRGFDADGIDIFFHLHNGMQVIAVTVQVTHKGCESAFEVKGHLAVGALVHKADAHPARHEGHLTEALDERIKFIIDIFGEDLLIEFETLPGARVVLLDLTDLLDLALRHTALIVLLPEFAVAFDFGRHPFGERVDRADTHTVQTTRDLISTAAELTARADDSHYYVHGFHRLAIHILFCRMRSNGNTAAVVLHRHTAICMDRDIDIGAISGKRLIDGVIHHLIDKVM